MVKYFLFILIVLKSGYAGAQDSIQLPPTDTMSVTPPVKKPAIRKPLQRKKELAAVRDTFQQVKLKPKSTQVSIDTLLYTQHPFYKFTNPIRYAVTLRKWKGKEGIFYAVIVLLLFFAVIRNGFKRYIHDLFKIFLRTTVNQRQVKEQLLQSPLPSFLLNILFMLTVGLFIALLLQHFGLAMNYNFWFLFLYAIAGLIVIYLVKFISLKLVGWVFQVSEAVDAYIFIVFTTNKVIGMMLLPFLVVLAFTYGFINESAINLGIFLVVALFAYRYFLSYVAIHRLVKINFFHFMLYLMAFEIVPLLLINKLLFRLLGETS